MRLVTRGPHKLIEDVWLGSTMIIPYMNDQRHHHLQPAITLWILSWHNRGIQSTDIMYNVGGSVV